MDAKEYARRVATRCKGFESIWLIGSRANGSARADSDWDLLAFGDPAVLACLRAASDLHDSNVDFLVVTNGEDFESAWGSKKKTGSLSQWDWNASADEAHYTGTKWVENDEEGRVDSNPCKGVRVWP